MAKVLHRAGGLALLEHVLRAARSASTDVRVVVGHQADKVKALFPEVAFIDQKEQLGTGHAVMMAREQFAEYGGDLLILAGDAPLVRPETIQEFVQFHRNGHFKASVLTAEVPNPTGYGRIVRGGDGQLERIVEHRDASAEVLKIAEINSSIYVFQAPALFEALTKVRNQNAQSEYYLTDVIGILGGQGQRIGAYKAADSKEILGINTRQELADVDRVMRRRKCESLMSSGVTIVDPETTFIDSDVEIGPDTVIYPSVQIEGRSQIAEDVTIRSFSRITNCRIGGASVVLEGCIIVDSTLGEQVSVGPYAHLRMNTVLADTVKVGNFVEVKNSSVGYGTKSMHLTYLGDATIGRNVNVGAGTITCNYDGVKKNPTVIEDEVFIGSDSQLIAPVRIGKGAYVAAGSSITDDVPPESLAIARGRQSVKEGWVRERKKKQGK
jgi:bifunctional UDP-N-acetylglucosamine pyrophosphorylase/glucosamine-1-phosphate N-acetyltransferase